MILLISTVALPSAVSIADCEGCVDIAECPMDEDETEEESRVPSSRILEEDLEQQQLVNQHIFFTSLINQKQIAYIKNYVPTVFDVPTEPPEVIG